MNIEPLLTVRQAAEALNVSVRQLWRLIAAGKLRARRIGRVVRIRAEDVTALIDES